jgi:hypothetical protein
VPWRILLRHWEAVFEHDRELAFDGVPFAHLSLPLGRGSIQREIDQLCSGFIAGEVASGSDGTADF